MKASQIKRFSWFARVSVPRAWAHLIVLGRGVVEGPIEARRGPVVRVVESGERGEADNAEHGVGAIQSVACARTVRCFGSE